MVELGGSIQIEIKNNDIEFFAGQYITG